MPFGDMKFNGKIFEDGICRCHGQGDILTDSKGDIATVTDPVECIKQRIVIWLGTRKGERLDRTFGCPIFSYINKPLTSSNLKLLKGELEEDLAKLLPEEEVQQVRVFSYAPKEVEVMIRLARAPLQFKVTEESLLALNEEIRVTLRELGFQAVWDGEV